MPGWCFLLEFLRQSLLFSLLHLHFLREISPYASFHTCLPQTNVYKSIHAHMTLQSLSRCWHKGADFHWRWIHQPTKWAENHSSRRSQQFAIILGTFTDLMSCPSSPQSQCAGGQMPWGPTRKVEGEAGHAPSTFAVEVHPAWGTLMFGDLSKREKLRESHPYMELSFQEPVFFIGCLLCALYLMGIVQQVLPTSLWFLRAGERCGLPPPSIPDTGPLGQAKAPLDST